MSPLRSLYRRKQELVYDLDLAIRRTFTSVTSHIGGIPGGTDRCARRCRVSRNEHGATNLYKRRKLAVGSWVS